MSNSESTADVSIKPVVEGESAEVAANARISVEIGGREGPDPVRYGDWEKNGRCIDF